jgi:hypothetical protein
MSSKHRRAPALGPAESLGQAGTLMRACVGSDLEFRRISVALVVPPRLHAIARYLAHIDGELSALRAVDKCVRVASSGFRSV